MPGTHSVGTQQELPLQCINPLQLVADLLEKFTIFGVSNTDSGLFSQFVDEDRPPRLMRILPLFLLLLFSATGFVCGQEQWLVEANRLTVEFRQNLDTLAKKCDDGGLSDAATKIRLCVPPQNEEKIYIPKLPIKILQKTPADNKPAEKKSGMFDWEAELWEMRRTYANKLFVCAKAAAKRDRGSVAMQMALAALHANPDHPEVRNLLGFRRYNNEEWRTAWEADRLKKGYVDHPRFGWILEKNVKRYEAGERLNGKKWVNEKEDRHLRQIITKGWKIESEHYALITNHSIEEGVRLSRKLEDLYRAWKLLFYRYMASDEGLATLFEGKGKPKPGKKHDIIVFRDRDDYVSTLSRKIPFAPQTLGFYTSDLKRCFFFTVGNKVTWSEREEVDRTLLHEATHQLFSESRPTSELTALAYNFWIIEGIAMYMETLRSEGDYYVVGGADDIRFDNAMEEALDSKFYVPMELLVKLGRPPFQNSPKIQELYSQSAGLAHFFMHADGGAYRDATVNYLRLVYEDKDEQDTLEILTKKSYAELDELYIDYLKDKAKNVAVHE